MAEGERATGTPNTIYDLSSVLFHALEGGASYDTYIEDAEMAGDEELAGFFRRVRDEDSNRADEAQRLLAERTSTTGRTGGGAAAGGIGSASPRPEPSGDFPGTEPIREDASTARRGEVPPPPEEVPPERAGEIPTAEEVPPPRAEEVPGPGGGASGVPPQAPPGDLTPPVPGGIPYEDDVPPTPPPPRGTPDDAQRETPIEPSQAAEERAGQAEREEDKGLIDRVTDAARGALSGREEPEREDPEARGASREPRRGDPPPRRQ